MSDCTLFKPKPWWLRAVTPRHFWVTLSPVVYYPRTVDIQTMLLRHAAGARIPTIEHERVHILQQNRYGLARYITLYILSRRFRYEAELEAGIAELKAIRDQGGFRAYTERAHEFAQQLSGTAYWWCAPSYDDAFNRLVQGVLR